MNDTVERIQSFWSPDIGHLSETQRDFVIHELEQINPSSVLEIGFAGGRHTVTVLSCCKPTKMISMDIDFDYQNGRSKVDLINEQFDNIEFLEENSRTALTEEFFESNFPNGLDYILVDGCHSYGGAISDMEKCYPHLNSGGLMVVDDYQSKVCPLPSVDRAIEVFAKVSGLEFETVSLSDGKGMALFRK